MPAPDPPACLTPDRLAAFWPEASRRLLAALAAHGIGHANAEDLVSETVVRALTTQVTASSVDEFCRWAYRVARNLHVDALRAGARLAPEWEADEGAHVVDSTYQVELRMFLEAVVRSIGRLPDADRHAILDGIGAPTPADRREAVRLAVRRHRARVRLLRLVDGPAERR